MTSSRPAGAGPAAAWEPPGAAQPGRLARLPSRLLLLTAACADRLVSQGLAGAGARKWHYAALAALAEGGPGSQAALSRRTGIHRGDLITAITELAVLGQVEQTPDHGDRRRSVITLTAAGRRQLSRLDRLIAGIQDDLLVPLSAAERAERADLIGLLSRLLDYHAGP